jgi:hypothetical protein
MKYHYSHCFFTYTVRWKKAVNSNGGGFDSLCETSESYGAYVVLCVLCVWCGVCLCCMIKLIIRKDPYRVQYQAGSLTGAVHLSKNNEGVLRSAQRGQKPRIEQKDKCWLDLDFQYEYRP